MAIFEKKERQNLIKIHPKTHEMAVLKKFLGEHAPEPPSNTHGFAMRSMSLCDMQIPKSGKKILGPSLPNPGYAPVSWNFL